MKKYTDLTLEILASIPDDELDEAIIGYMATVIGNDYTRSYEVVTGLSDGFQMVYSTCWLEAEVNNGGFHQYFWNSSSQFFENALRGFKLIGAIEHAKLLEQAFALLVKEGGPPEQFGLVRTVKAYIDSCEDIDFDQIDDAFYGLSEDLPSLRIQYIREHPGEFKS